MYMTNTVLQKTERPKSRTIKSAMKVKTNAQKRLLISPRSHSRRSKRKTKTGQESPSRKSNGSQPDSPQRELPG